MEFALDRIDRLKIFVRIYECASFTDAAGNLRIPRSTASLAVQELEARLGTQLFHRTTRRVTPTHDGTVLYERVVGLLADVEETETLFRHGAKPKGHLRIDAPSRIARRVISPALPDFFAQYPDIEIEIGGTDRPVDLIGEAVDCVIRVGNVFSTSLYARHLGEIELINCASPLYLGQYGTPTSLDDLQSHMVVKFASSSKVPREDWEYVRQGIAQTLTVPARVCATDAENYIACCLAGLGLIQIPKFDVQSELDSGQLVQVLADESAAPMALNLLWSDRRTPTRRLRVFLDWVSELLRSQVLRNAS